MFCPVKLIWTENPIFCIYCNIDFNNLKTQMQSLHGCKNIYSVFIRKKALEKDKRVYKKCGFQIIKNWGGVKYFLVIWNFGNLVIFFVWDMKQEMTTLHQSKINDGQSVKRRVITFLLRLCFTESGLMCLVSVSGHGGVFRSIMQLDRFQRWPPHWPEKLYWNSLACY